TIEKFQQLPARVDLRCHLITNVGPVEAADEPLGIAQLQALGYFTAGGNVGRRGQRDARHLWKALGKNTEAEVVLAKIVTPLTDAMCFVDSEQRDVDALEKLQRARLQQALGRYVEHVEFARLQLHFHRALGIDVER